MKVAEKESDRTAEVHLRAGAIVDPLAEFGEYVADDGAICCYVPVPVEEKQKIWISGKLSGTTLQIWYDAIVDGVQRKASSYIAKKVGFQKNKKLDIDRFLYKTVDSSFIDTDMVVDQINAGVLVTKGDMTETIGTIELRVYVTRQLGVEYTPRDIEKYHSPGENGTDLQQAEFKKIRPTLQMAFEQDSALLDPTNIRKEQKKADQSRPGKTPWAIFRFHYRTPESMAEHNLKVTFDPSLKVKDQPEARMLQLEPVPPLPVPAAKKDDGDAASTKTSSPAPPDTPLTPIKGESTKPTTSTPKKPLPKTASKPAKSMALEQNTTVPGGDKAITGAEIGKLTELSTDRLHDELANKADGAASAKDDTAKVIEEKPAESDTIAVTMPKNKSSTQNSTPEKPSTLAVAPHDSDNVAKRNTSVAVVITPKGPQGGNAAPQPAQSKPNPITTPQNLGNLKPTTTGIPPATATKRSAPPANSTTPDNKRAKPTPVPAPTTPTIVTRIPPGSPMGSPRPMSTERKVAELRKARDALRRKREDTATKQAELDEKMKPYKKKMEDELERLRLEMLEEEAMAVEDEEHLKASEEMLAEYERADGDN